MHTQDTIHRIRANPIQLAQTVRRASLYSGCLALTLITFVLPISPTQAVSVTDFKVAYNSATQKTHLEVRLKDREVILYQGSRIVKRYPIGVGRPGWETPTGTFQVRQKQRNPIWINPFTNETIAPADPRNPLGGYWIGFWTDGNNWVGFHGTLDPDSVGKAESHGCLHMYRRDLADLFSQVGLGTPVRVVQ